MAWDKKIPFDPTTGELMYYPRDTWTVEGRKPPDWRDNSEFEDTLKFVGFERGRSAANAAFLRADGTRCTMFLTDLEAVMPQLFAGCLQGTFTWCKRGQNFGIRMLAPKPVRYDAPPPVRAVPLPYYPPDGGLKPQVRPFAETLSAFEVIRNATPKEMGCSYLTQAQQQIHGGGRR